MSANNTTGQQAIDGLFGLNELLGEERRRKVFMKRFLAC